MTIPIKFRYWDHYQQKMNYLFDEAYKLIVNPVDGTVYCGGYNAGGYWHEPPLMRYAGLTDKVGT
jgi:hypothetical protein